MHALVSKRGSRQSALLGVCIAAGVLAAPSARAQDPEPAAAATAAAAAPPPAPPPARPLPPPPPPPPSPATLPVQADDQTEWVMGRMDPPRAPINWQARLETDVGYAKYKFAANTSPNEEYFDFRGRFVFGPLLNYSFGDDYFIRAKGEIVGWIREINNVYQVNVDAVYAQFGKRGLFDFKIGRFRTWRVYHKDYASSLYTLDDTGALQTGPFDNADFGPHTYEASYMYQFETPGRAAIHFYPSPWSGIELAGAYGKDGTSNTAGFRGAGILHFDFLRISAAGEYRFYRPAQDVTITDASNNKTPCDTCGITKKSGFAGSAEIFIKPAGIMAGADYGQGRTKIWSAVDGTYTTSGYLNGSHKITSVGGYLQFDLGSLIMSKSLIFGGSLHRTEIVNDNLDFRRHIQPSVYAMYGLGFNDAWIKLVFSSADLDAALVNKHGEVDNSKMYAGRVRFEFNY